MGLLYLQGESDSSGEAAIADVRLGDLVENLRTDLSAASSMHAVVGGILAVGGNNTTVRTRQATLAASNGTIRKRFAQGFFEAGVIMPNFGKLVFMGDWITQGGLGYPSDRYELFKHLEDAGAHYTFTGSVVGAYQGNAGTTPTYKGRSFLNVHVGHFGWRVFWENGRIPLPLNCESFNKWDGAESKSRKRCGGVVGGNFCE